VIERSPLSDEQVEVRVLPEDIDASNAETIGHALADAVGPDTRWLVLDLGPTRYLDSSGVDMLFKLSERVHAGRRSLRLVVPPESRLHRLLRIAAVHTVIEIDDSLPAAMAAAGEQRQPVDRPH
jgi:anti-anti-sigma factor